MACDMLKDDIAEFVAEKQREREAMERHARELSDAEAIRRDLFENFAREN